MKQKFKGVMEVFVLCSKLFSFVWLAKSKNNDDKKRRLPWDKNVHTNSLSKLWVKKMHAENGAKIKLRNSNGKDLKTTTACHVYNADCNLFIPY